MQLSKKDGKGGDASDSSAPMTVTQIYDKLFENAKMQSFYPHAPLFGGTSFFDIIDDVDYQVTMPWSRNNPPAGGERSRMRRMRVQ